MTPELIPQSNKVIVLRVRHKTGISVNAETSATRNLVASEIVRISNAGSRSIASDRLVSRNTWERTRWYPRVRGGTRLAYCYFGYLHPEFEVLVGTRRHRVDVCMVLLMEVVVSSREAHVPDHLRVAKTSLSLLRSSFSSPRLPISPLGSPGLDRLTISG